jgi:hypothetical protein
LRFCFNVPEEGRDQDGDADRDSGADRKAQPQPLGERLAGRVQQGGAELVGELAGRPTAPPRLSRAVVAASLGTAAGTASVI